MDVDHRTGLESLGCHQTLDQTWTLEFLSLFCAGMVTPHATLPPPSNMRSQVPLDLDISGSLFSRITTPSQNGPGISLRGTRDVVISQTRVEHCWADGGAYGGAVELVAFPHTTAWAGSAELRISDSSFINNTVGGRVGGRVGTSVTGGKLVLVAF